MNESSELSKAPVVIGTRKINIPDTKEAQTTSSEQWENMSDEMINALNMNIEETGAINMRSCREVLILENAGKKRIDHLETALSFGSADTALKHKMNGENVSFGISVGIADKDQISALINFATLKGEGDVEATKKIGEAVEKANEILRTFDQPEIPAFKI